MRTDGFQLNIKMNFESNGSLEGVPVGSTATSTRTVVELCTFLQGVLKLVKEESEGPILEKPWKRSSVRSLRDLIFELHGKSPSDATL